MLGAGYYGRQSRRFQPDAGQPSASTYEPPTYPQYSPDPTEEELAMAMLDSDEQITGPGIGEAITFMPPGGLAAKGLGAATKSLLQLLKRGKWDNALNRKDIMEAFLRQSRLESRGASTFTRSERARLGPDEYKQWRRRAQLAQERDPMIDPSGKFKYRSWWSYPDKKK